jgi:hypothetical protein
VSFGIFLEAHLGHLEYGLLYGIFLRNIMSDMAHVLGTSLGTWFMDVGTCLRHMV